MNIVYSFNKRGFEANYWAKEIEGASNREFRFIPFNHDPYLDPNLYVRAQLLDNLYFMKNSDLFRLYADFDKVIADSRAEAIIVDTCPPYHPDYLRNLPCHKTLRIADGPLSAYDRDFAYLHAYDLILYHSPGYSRDMDMREKLEYCRANGAEFWPLALFDTLHDTTKTEDTIMSHERDIDVIFIGALYPGKMPLLAKLCKALGSRIRMHGRASVKANVYYNVKYGWPGWLTPVEFTDYVPLYQRSKIGINIHNRGKYTVGSYRLFDLPGNGVMQISDGGEYLDSFFRVGHEIQAYENVDDLVDKIRYYLSHDAEREQIALNGYRRVTRDHRIAFRLHQAGRILAKRIRQI